ncbi:MAG: right-handed parallel beta-helix repeat-containing protein [Bacteroidota bacterium]
MKKISMVVLSILMLVVFTAAQQKNTTKQNGAQKAAAAFVVNSPKQTDAYDDPDTDADEAKDGTCEDENGDCTITAATQEAENMEVPVSLTFSSSMTIALIPDGSPMGLLLSGSKIFAGGNAVTLKGAPMFGSLDLEDNCDISGITFDNFPVTLLNGNTIKGCTFTNTGSTMVAFLSVDGSNNIIGGVNASDKNEFKNSKAYAVTLAHSSGDGMNQIIGNTFTGNSGGILLAGNAGEGKNIITGNTISGTKSNGISIMSSDLNEIRRNMIGTNAAGTSADGNLQNGILLLNSSGNIIEENVISGNLQSGLVIAGDDERATGSSSNIVRANFIGVSKSMQPIPNGLVGIEFINNAKNNIIGSTLATDVDTNVIAYNSKGSIVTKMDPASGGGLPEKNIFRRNRMFFNGNPGIVLEPGSQGNVPVATVDSIQRLESGDLIVWGKGKQNCIVDVYAAEPNSSQYGEGEQWLEKGPVDQNGVFQVNIGSVKLDCDFITVLQTDENNNTSSNAFNFGLAPNMVLLTQRCEPSLFGAVPYANNKYTVHVDWKGLPKVGTIEFSLNGHTQPGTINGDLVEVEYNMAQSVVGQNQLTWKLTTCENREATGMNLYQFCGTAVPGWLEPVTAMCGGGHMKYKHTQTFPDIPAIASGLGVPSSMAFIGGLVLSFVGAPSFTATLNIPGESEPIESDATFAIGDYRTEFSITGTANTSFAGCNDIDLTGTLHLTAEVARDFSYGLSFGTIPCPSVPGLEQICQMANAISHSLRVGATLSGQITGTATLAPGIALAGGGGGATLALTPFLDVFPFHARGTGQLALSFTVPDFSVTSVTPSLILTVSESISGSSKTWTFPNAMPGAEEGKGIERTIAQDALLFPYIPAAIPAIAQDTTVENGIPWNARPSFAAGPNGVKAFAWVTSKIVGGKKVSDIALKYFDGTAWRPTITVTNDVNVDRFPTVAADKSGNIVVCWEHHFEAEAYPESLQFSTAVVKGYNISYSSYDVATGLKEFSGTVGTPNWYDGYPALSRGNDGSVMLVWQKNDGTSIYGTDVSPSQFVVAGPWSGAGWLKFDTLTALRSKMFRWTASVHNEQNMMIAYVQDTQGDLSTGNDWEIFAQKKVNGVWEVPQQLTTNAVMEYGVNSAYAQNGTPIVTWMRDTSIIGSIGALPQSQEIWMPNAGMGFFTNAFAAGKDTMALFWNEGSSVVMSLSPIASRSWSKPKFVHFTTEIQRSVNAQFDDQGSLHIGFQQSPYLTQPGQFSDSGALHVLSLGKLSAPLSVRPSAPAAPKQFALLDAFPNPFNASSTIRFILPKQGYTVLTVTNILGREVARLADGELKEGEHSFTFSADNFASGIYFYTLRSGGLVQTKKMILIK